MNNFFDYLDRSNPDLADADLAAVRAALVSRGPRKGTVLQSKPTKKGPEACGAWASLIGWLAPERIDVAGQFFAPRQFRETYNCVDAWLQSSPAARLALNCLGQAPFQYNLWHYRNDAQAVTLLLDETFRGEVDL